jgi:hypothetical protein
MVPSRWRNRQGGEPVPTGPTVGKEKPGVTFSAVGKDGRDSEPANRVNAIAAECWRVAQLRANRGVAWLVRHGRKAFDDRRTG